MQQEFGVPDAQMLAVGSIVTTRAESAPTTPRKTPRQTNDTPSEETKSVQAPGYTNTAELEEILDNIDIKQKLPEGPADVATAVSMVQSSTSTTTEAPPAEDLARMKEQSESDALVLAKLEAYRVAQGVNPTIPERQNKRRPFFQARKLERLLIRLGAQAALVSVVFNIRGQLVIRLNSQEMRTLLDHQNDFFALLTSLSEGCQMCAHCGSLAPVKVDLTGAYHGRGRCEPAFVESMETISGSRFNPLFGIEVSFLNQKMCLPICNQKDALLLREGWSDFILQLERYAEPAETIYYLTIHANQLTEGDHKYFESLDSVPACYIGRTFSSYQSQKNVRSLSSDSAPRPTEKFSDPTFEFRIDTSRFNRFDKENLRRLYAGYHMEETARFKK